MPFLGGRGRICYPPASALSSHPGTFQKEGGKLGEPLPPTQRNCPASLAELQVLSWKSISPGFAFQSWLCFRIPEGVSFFSAPPQRLQLSCLR